MVNWDITELWYIMAGVADAQADGRETGFRTAFGDEDYFFYAFETGVRSRLNSKNGPMGAHTVQAYGLMGRTRRGFPMVRIIAMIPVFILVATRC